MRNFAFLIGLLLCFTACNKHKNSTSSPQVHEFKGIAVINSNGEIMGEWGTDDGDWGNDATWSAEEFQLLNFQDTVSLSGTYVRDTVGWNIGPGIHVQPHNEVLSFTNPAASQQYLVYFGLGLLKFKAVIVDKYFNPLFTYCSRDSGRVVHIDLSDSTKFQNGVICRMYYSFSATDSLHFYKGHGDILICREQTLNDCRKYVP